MILIKQDCIEMLGTNEELISDYIVHYLAMRKEHNDLLMLALSMLHDYEQTGAIIDLLNGMNDPLDK